MVVGTAAVCPRRDDSLTLHHLLFLPVYIGNSATGQERLQLQRKGAGSQETEILIAKLCKVGSVKRNDIR